MNEQFKTLFISFNHCPTKRQYFSGNEGKGKECPASRELRWGRHKFERGPQERCHDGSKELDGYRGGPVRETIEDIAENKEIWSLESLNSLTTVAGTHEHA